jgi:hypothetical protein
MEVIEIGQYEYHHEKARRDFQHDQQFCAQGGRDNVPKTNGGKSDHAEIIELQKAVNQWAARLDTFKSLCIAVGQAHIIQ